MTVLYFLSRGNRHAIELPARWATLEEIERFNEMDSEVNLTYPLMQRLERWEDNPTVRVTNEKFLSQYRLRTMSKVYVFVPGRSLNQYVSSRIVFRNGRYPAYIIKREIDAPKLIKAWEKDGCPLKWTPKP